MTSDYLPRELPQTVRNLIDFGLAGGRATAMDGWQFLESAETQRYSATFIDQGYCFNTGVWTFPDSPLRGAYANN